MAPVPGHRPSAKVVSHYFITGPTKEIEWLHRNTTNPTYLSGGGIMTTAEIDASSAEPLTLAGTAKGVAKQLRNLSHGQVVAWVLPDSHEANATTIELIRGMAGLIQTSVTEQNEKTLASLIEALVPRTPPPPALLKEAAMTARARNAVMQGANWLTASELAKIAGLSDNNPSAQPSKWKKNGVIFAISYNGIDYYPGYGLDPEQGYRPIKTLKPIIDCFKGSRNGWGLAYWFGSANSYLGGKYPKDLLASDPSKVLAAAADEMEGVAHG